MREASQAPKERWQCCRLLEALDGSRGYKVSGRCKKSVAGDITVYTDHKNCSFATTKGLDQTASALVRAPRRVQL
jgi:hypothetical protein